MASSFKSNFRLLSVAVMWLTIAELVVAIEFAGFDATTHERYLSGQPNPDFIIDESKIAGVGGRPGDRYNQAALISPKHVITSRHNGVIGSARFRKRDGTFRSYALVTEAASPSHPDGYIDLTTILPEGGGNVLSDIRLYRLTEAIPAADGVVPMPIFAGDIGKLVGQEIFVMGKDNRAGRNVIKTVTMNEVAADNKTYVHAFTFDTEGNGGTDGLGVDEVRLEAGDSGHPALIPIGDKIALLGAHNAASNSHPAFAGLPVGLSSLLAPYLGEIQTIVQGDGYEITTVTLIPEPSSPGMLVLAIGFAALRRRHG